MKNSVKYIFSTTLIIIGFVLLFVGIGLGATFKDLKYYKTESFELDFSDEKITSLDIDFSVGKLIIKRGDSFKVVADEISENSAQCSVEGETLVIKSKKKYFFGFEFIGSSVEECRLTVYIPYDAEIESLELDFGVGSLEVSDLELERLTVKSGVGECWFKNVSSEKTQISTGVGAQSFEDCSFNDLSLDTGIGEVNISGDITGRSDISGGIGEIDIEIYGNYEDYGFDVSKGIGDVKINGGKYRGVSDSSVKHKIYITNGIGEIKIVIN
jgi:hypothetical protein